MTTMTMLEAIRETLRAEMLRDDRVMLLGLDVGRMGGVFRASDGLFSEFGPDRVVDMPLAEGAIVGSAIGLAISGLSPVVEIQFLGFAQQALHQIAPHVARMRYRSRGRFALPLTIRAPFGGGVKTPELHADALEGLFTQCPGLKVVMPATAADAKGLLTTAIRDPDPVLFCEPLRGYRLVRGEVPDGEHAVPFGRARIARDGKDVTIVAWSAAVHLAEQAADVLARDGIEATVLDLRTLVPLDVETLVSTVERTGRCVVVHEAPLTSGFGGEVVATLASEAFYSLRAPIARVTAPDAPYPLAGIEQWYVPSVAHVVAKAKEAMQAA